MENLTQNEQDLQQAKRQVEKIKGFYTHLFIYLIINVFIIASAFFDRPFTFDNFFRFSTFATAFFWGIGIVAHWSGVFGKNIFFGKDWEQRKIQEYMNSKK